MGRLSRLVIRNLVVLFLAFGMLSFPGYAETKLTFLGINIDANLEASIHHFEAEHPGVTVDIVEGFARNSDEFHVKLMNLWIAGGNFDAFHIQEGFTKIYYDHGMLEPLDGYMAKDRFNANDFLVPKAQVYGGQRIGFPTGGAVYALRINKDMFANAGLAPANEVFAVAESKGKAFESWNLNTFVTNAKRLTKDINGDGKVDQWGFTMDMPGSVFWLNTLLWAHGVKGLYTADGKTSNLGDPNAVNALEFAQSLVLQHGVQPPPQITANFNSSGVAMKALWVTAGSSADLQNATFAWSHVPIPAGVSGFRVLTGSPGVGVSSRSQNKQLAYELIKAITDGKWQLEALDNGQAIATNRLTVLRSPKMKSLVGNTLDLVFSAAAKYAHEYIPYIEWAAIRTLFTNTNKKLLNGELGPSQAAAGLHQQVQLLLDGQK